MKYKLYIGKLKTKKITSKTSKETVRSNRPQPFGGYQKWRVRNHLDTAFHVSILRVTPYVFRPTIFYLQKPKITTSNLQKNRK